MKTALSQSWLANYRVDRLARLERENEHLRAEQLRLTRLLGRALQVAVSGTATTVPALLGVLCEFEGTDPARPAFMEHRERMASKARIDQLVKVLRDTAP